MGDHRKSPMKSYYFELVWWKLFLQLHPVIQDAKNLEGFVQDSREFGVAN